MKSIVRICLVFVLVFLPAASVGSPENIGKVTARDYGLTFGELPTGHLNAITDVKGVLVGHKTMIEGDKIRTGVTVVLPHSGNLYKEKVPAAIHLGNGYGKLAGYTQVRELGEIESPIILTNTLSIGPAVEGGVRYMIGLPGNERVKSVNIVAGECNDGRLNDIRGLHVKPHHVLEAIKNAKPGHVEQGNVGGGTGTRCHRFKGGIGTSSRVLPGLSEGYTVGVLVQTNFGKSLHIRGVPVGDILRKKLALKTDEFTDWGSCMVVIATDAPLDSRKLERLAARAMLAIGKTGSVSSTTSGDYIIAFSTAPEMRIYEGNKFSGGATFSHKKLNPMFKAVVEATEEAIINALFAAQTMTGYRGKTLHALPEDETIKILKEYNRLQSQ